MSVDFLHTATWSAYTSSSLLFLHMTLLPLPLPLPSRYSWSRLFYMSVEQPTINKCDYYYYYYYYYLGRFRTTLSPFFGQTINKKIKKKHKHTHTLTQITKAKKERKRNKQQQWSSLYTMRNFQVFNLVGSSKLGAQLVDEKKKKDTVYIDQILHDIPVYGEQHFG